MLSHPQVALSPDCFTKHDSVMILHELFCRKLVYTPQWSCLCLLLLRPIQSLHLNVAIFVLILRSLRVWTLVTWLRQPRCNHSPKLTSPSCRSALPHSNCYCQRMASFAQATCGTKFHFLFPMQNKQISGYSGIKWWIILMPFND